MVDEMFDSGKRSGGCGSGPEAVSYLYGELDAEGRRAFEEHLSTCERCTEELAAFSLIRLSVAELERTNFAPEENSRGIFAELRLWIAAYPLLIKGLAGAAAAIVVTLAVLGFVFFTGSSGKDNLAANNAPDETVPVKKVNGTSQDEGSPLEVTRSTETEETGNSSLPEAGNELRPDALASAAKNTTARGTRRTKTPERRLPTNQVADKNEAPRLSEAAEENVEDDSPRLTDLFAETGSGD